MCDYRVVEIERGVGGNFGFSVIGGIDTELPPMICALVHNGSAQLSGKVNVGDVLVEVNDECVTRLEAKKVAETLRHSPDTVRLRLRKDPEAAARARHHLRRFSVQDPRVNQFQTKVHRSASLPSRAQRPKNKGDRNLRARIDEGSTDMPKGRIRTVGEVTSPTGIDSGADGVFRKRVSSRSGSFSRLTTSFPAHGGPPSTVENSERTASRSRFRGDNDKLLERTTSGGNSSSSRKESLQSSSLPEIAVSQVEAVDSSILESWCRSSSTEDALVRRSSFSTESEKESRGSNNNRSEDIGSTSSLPQDRLDRPSLSVEVNSDPYRSTTSQNALRSLGNSVQTGSDQLSTITSKRDENPASLNLEKTSFSSSGESENLELSCDELARRLFFLEGYQRKDISPMLYKNNDYSKAVAVQFMKYFDFKDDSLVDSLRKLLNKFNLTGETQERERILIPFSNRYFQCNNPEYGSADAVHTLVCAIMLLNTDLHGEQTMGKRMKSVEFIKNLSGLCDGNDYPVELLKDVYSSIKSKPLELNSEDIPSNKAAKTVQANGKDSNATGTVEAVGSLALMGYQTADDDVIYKEGLLYRKLIEDTGGKKTSAWKRAWQPFFATLRGMIMFLHKPDETRSFDDTRFSLGVHHSFASPAMDYRKRPAVFRFITADWKVMLFQARNKTDMFEWVEGLNLVAASYSSPPLPAPVGSCKKFQKPVLPFSRTRLTLTQQLTSHEKKAQEMESVLIEHLQKQPTAADTRQRDMEEWLEKRDFFEYEYKRYRSYANILKSSKLQTQVRERTTKNQQSAMAKRNGLLSDTMRRYSSLNDLLDATDGGQKPYTNYRESYFMAIYRG